MIEEGELRDDSKSMWAGLGNPKFMENLLNHKKEKVVTKTVSKIKRAELIKVVEVCNTIMKNNELLVQHWTSKEQYFKANEAKVTYTIHRDFALVLSRILNGGDYIEQQLEVIDDSPPLHVI